MNTSRLWKLGIALISFVSLTAFQTDDLIELTQHLNGRSSAQFRVKGEKIDRNIVTVVAKGTVAKVKGVKTLPSGNDGLQVEIQDGPNKGKTVWIYYRKDNPGMKLYQSEPKSPDAPATVKANEPEKATHAVATRDHAAVVETKKAMPELAAAAPVAHAAPAANEPAKAEVAAEPAKQPQSGVDFRTSTVDLGSAISCYHALQDNADFDAGYPAGMVAVPGKQAGRSGAFLFDEKSAEFFAGLDPSPQTWEFQEFYGDTIADVAPMVKNFRQSAKSDPNVRNDALSPEARGFFANTLAARMGGFAQAADENDVKRAYLEKLQAPEVKLSEEELKAMVGLQTDMLALKKAQDKLGKTNLQPLTAVENEKVTTIEQRAKVVASQGKHFIPSADEFMLLQRKEANGRESEALRTFANWWKMIQASEEIDAEKTRLSKTKLSRQTIDQALQVCEKIKDEDRLVKIATYLRKELAKRMSAAPAAAEETAPAKKGTAGSAQ